MFFIYKITNKINNKVYIGKTNDLKRRWAYHCSSLKNKKKMSYIAKAIQKYGKDNFIFDVIFCTDDAVLLSKKEYEFIIENDSLVPNGYNLTTKTDGNITFSKESKKKLAISIQHKITKKKKDASSEYIGIISRTDQQTFCLSIRHDKKMLSKTFPTELEAAEMYDKLALYIFGDNARLNFDNKRAEYINLPLEEIYNNFIQSLGRKKSSIYKFVARYKQTDKWRIRKDALNISNKLKIGLYNDEIDAAEIVDYLIIYYNLNYTLNFPDKKYNIEDINNRINTWNLASIKTSIYEGVSYHKKDKSWRAYIYINKKYIFIGNYKTENEAYIARENYINNLSLLH